MITNWIFWWLNESVLLVSTWGKVWRAVWRKSILTLGNKGKTVLRDPCSTFTLLELLFARIYGQKIAQLCVENSKQNLLSNSTFGAYQQFRIIFTVLKKSPHRCKASVEARKLNLVLFPAIIRIVFLGIKYRKLQN